MKNKRLIYIDMDDTLCDFLGRYHEFRKAKPEIDFPQSIPGFFENLEPIEGAIESVNALRESDDFEVYILTAPSTRNPLSYTEKRLWVEKHFDYSMVERLILSPDKSLFKDDILIDDYASGKGQDQFEGKLIQFGSDEFPDWASVMNELLVREDSPQPKKAGRVH